MIFPKPTISVGECIAIEINGLPSFVRYRQVGTRKFYPNDPKFIVRWASHRLSYCLNNGDIPRCPSNLIEGLVLHRCHNKWCINPEHLYLGTQKQNKADMFNHDPTIRKRITAGITGLKRNAQFIENARQNALRQPKPSPATRAKMSASAFARHNKGGLQ